jgi:deferrochelatase/peroxidase EfeB
VTLTTRRAVLGGLAALPLTGLAGCMFRDDPVAGASHPALTPPREAAVCALVAVPADRAKARAVLTTVAARVRGANVTGVTAASLAIGHTWFDKAGLGDRRPPGATGRPRFTGDAPIAERVGGDVLVLLEADRPPAATSGMAAMLAGLSGYGAVVRWQVACSRPENEVRDGRATARDALGFVTGLGNRDSRDGPAVDDVTLIRSGAGVPAWAVGGTYLAADVVRLDRDAWNAEPPAQQENIVGRRTDGRWLDGTPANEEPDFGADPYGYQTPLDSHVRLANPRPAGYAAPPLIRRSWNYAVTGSGGRETEAGVLFMCYQADIGAGYAAVKDRLEKQALNDYVRTVGGGYFVVPPPDPAEGTWERALVG